MSFIIKVRVLNTLVNKIRYNPGISGDELIEAIIDKTDRSYSRRTFLRDLKFLKEELKYFIHYDATSGGYHIDALEQIPEEDEFMNKSLAVLDTHNALTELDANADFVDISMQKSDLLNPSLQPIIQSIKKQRKINVQYFKLKTDEEKEYVLNPLLLKEYEYKWYLMADDDGVLKAFALDRIKNAELIDEQSDLRLMDYCKDKLDAALGVSMLNDEAQLVRLVATNKQAKYLKSYPIHYSQVVEEDNENVTIFQMHLIVNNELVMKILSYGGTVRVIGPVRLHDKIVQMVGAMSENLKSSQINIQNAHKLFMG